MTSEPISEAIPASGDCELRGWSSSSIADVLFISPASGSSTRSLSFAFGPTKHF